MVQASKRRLPTVTLVDKSKALKEIDGATAKKYGVKKECLKQLKEIVSQKREKE